MIFFYFECILEAENSRRHTLRFCALKNLFPTQCLLRYRVPIIHGDLFLGFNWKTLAPSSFDDINLSSSSREKHAFMRYRTTTKKRKREVFCNILAFFESKTRLLMKFVAKKHCSVECPVDVISTYFILSVLLLQYNITLS